MVVDTLENHPIKVTLAIALAFTLFIIVQSASVATWKADIENKIEHIDEQQQHLVEVQLAFNTNVNELDDRIDRTDVQMAEIKTKLTNIESLLIEIKQDLRDAE